MKKLSILVFTCMFLFNTVFGQTEIPEFDEIYQRIIPAWFNDAKFGIFVVWGIYSVPGWAPKGEYAEWYGSRMNSEGNKTKEYHDKVWGEDFTYDKFVPLLHGEGFSAEEWTNLFNKSGAKYVVTCANYHDGFAMYPTKYSVSKFGNNWNAFERGPKRDIIGELNESGRKKGLKMGIYYSIYEWWHPTYIKGDIEKYSLEFFHPKFKELINKYKPHIIFLDGEWEHSYKKWHSEELANWLYTKSPVRNNVVVNDRWGKTRSIYGDYFSSEYGGGDYPPHHPWQEDRGIGKSYGYNRNEDAWDYNSRGELLRLLSKVCSNGGNLLLDIGPKADGRIPPIMQERLLQIGEWLNLNGDAIYGTSASPFWPRKFEWGVCTGKNRKLFLHLFDHSIEDLIIQGIKNEIVNVKFLATAKNIRYNKSKDNLKLKLPATKPDTDVSIIEVTLKDDANINRRPHPYINNKIVIPAWSFENHGVIAKMIINGYERTAHMSNWTNCNDYLTSRFIANKPGEYEVSITYCSDSEAAGSKVEININSQNIYFISEDTGGWKGVNYQTKKCGTIKLTKSGEQFITISPVCKGWENLAIKEVILILLD